LLGDSEAMRNAFLDSAEMTTEGFMSLSKTVRELGEDFSHGFGQQIENVGKAQMEMNARKSAPQINLNGGQTFKIQQNFRDQDPDRVVVAFERRYTNAALKRVQSLTSTPFGT
jgi:hypothetical protein